MTKARRLTKSQRTRIAEKSVSFVVLLLVSILWVIPLLYMFGQSFKNEYELAAYPGKFFPTSFKNWTLDNYTGFIIREGKLDNMPVWMFNSLWSTGATVLLTVLMDLITAYALVFFDFKAKNYIVKFLLLWMAVPGVIGSASSYAIFSSVKRALGISTNLENYLYIYFWLIVPGCTGIFNMLLMRNFFNSIPKEIIESAKSDGASNMTIFRRIVCPLAKSTIMLIILFSFTGAWNNLTFPQLIMSGGENYWKTVTVALTGHTGASGWSRVGVNMATSVFALIPIIIVFLITQDKMIDGLASTGVKG